MSEQGRKREDISSHKSSRAAATALTPQLGAPAASPSLLAYPLPHPSHHEYSHHLYTMMRPGALAMAPQMSQSMQTPKSCLTSDMGPPIFMPSLNLGTPKGSSSSSSSSMPSPNTSSTGPNSSLSASFSSSSAAGGVTANAHPMSDMILSNAPTVSEYHHSIHHPSFYSAGSGMRPASGHMSIPTGSPQVSAVVANKRPSVSSGNIAKPTPVQATHGAKIGGGTYIKTLPPSTSKGVGTGSPLSIPGTSNKPSVIPSASSPGVIPVTIPISAGSPSFPPGSSVIKQPLSTQPRPPRHHLHSHAHESTVVSVHSGVVPSLQGYSPLIGKQPQTHPQRANPEPIFIAHSTMQGHVIPVAAYPAILPGHGAAGGGPAVVPHTPSSTLTELLAPSPAVATSSLRDGGGGGGKVGKVHDVAMRPYSPQHISSSSRHGPPGVRERSASGDAASSGLPSPQTRSETHTTSAQPTPNDHIDTRLERPAQPSSGPSGQLPSPQGVPSPYQGPHRERGNSTDMTNVIPIISNPGLTGRHIAAISSNQPPGYPPSNTAPPPPQSLQPQCTPVANPYRGNIPRSKLEYGEVDSGSFPPTHPTTLHLVPGSATSQVQNASPGGVGKLPIPSGTMFSQLAAVAAAAAQSTLTATVISSSSSSSSSLSVNSPGAAPHHPNSLPLTASGSPITSLSPSRRPGIIRKRPHESWTGSPNLNKIPFGSSMSLSSPGHAPRGGDNSHPLSPPISTHSPHHTMAESLTNHILSSDLDHPPPPPGDVVPSPRKKRRKQDVIATDDQYASNVPNNIRPPDVAMAMESDHASSLSPRQTVAVATRTRGRRDDSSSPREDSIGPFSAVATPLEGGGEKAEVQFLSQLRQPQWPINGVYRTHHRAAHNHFKRHADIKHIETETVTATGIANNKTAASRASGWKIYHLDPQLEEMLQAERDVLEMVKRVERSISNLSQCTTCPVPADVLDGLGEIIEGNVARSNRIISHLETTRDKMVKLLDHKPTVLDLLSKYSTNKRSSPLNSLPHKLRT